MKRLAWISCCLLALASGSVFGTACTEDDCPSPSGLPTGVLNATDSDLPQFDGAQLEISDDEAEVRFTTEDGSSWVLRYDVTVLQAS